ncbi:hypothetical protein EVG20_g6666 [Dentipellis fragilis]|uniref:Uncharacterized protein n=1 Tax=Dentipellis fragilis TaxID=205917 RepID=A0A4Y9YLS2_9AGAM|nr:hypothetical protein EVG20_g6666 [Dentipellis fragilis]
MSDSNTRFLYGRAATSTSEGVCVSPTSLAIIVVASTIVWIITLIIVYLIQEGRITKISQRGIEPFVIPPPNVAAPRAPEKTLSPSRYPPGPGTSSSSNSHRATIATSSRTGRTTRSSRRPEIRVPSSPTASAAYMAREALPSPFDALGQSLYASARSSVALQSSNLHGYSESVKGETFDVSSRMSLPSPSIQRSDDPSSDNSAHSRRYLCGLNPRRSVCISTPSLPLPATLPLIIHPPHSFVDPPKLLDIMAAGLGSLPSTLLTDPNTPSGPTFYGIASSNNAAPVASQSPTSGRGIYVSMEVIIAVIAAAGAAFIGFLVILILYVRSTRKRRQMETRVANTECALPYEPKRPDKRPPPMDLVALHAAGSYSPVPVESPRPTSMRASSPTPSSNILPPSPEPHSPVTRSAHTHSTISTQSTYLTHSTYISARSSAPTPTPEAQLRLSAIPSDLHTIAETTIHSRSTSINTRRRQPRSPPDD